MILLRKGRAWGQGRKKLKTIGKEIEKLRRWEVGKMGNGGYEVWRSKIRRFFGGMRSR